MICFQRDIDTRVGKFYQWVEYMYGQAEKPSYDENDIFNDSITRDLQYELYKQK